MNIEIQEFIDEKSTWIEKTTHKIKVRNEQEKSMPKVMYRFAHTKGALI